MKYYLIVMFSALINLISCADSSSAFKGRWDYKDSDPDITKEYTLWLDPDGKKVNQREHSDVIGVLRLYHNGAGSSAEYFNEIIEFKANGNIADIKYRKCDTEEIFKARITVDPQSGRLNWVDGGLYKSGPADKTDYEEEEYGYNATNDEPSDMEMTKTSDFANYKEIESDDVVCELPDRIFYNEDILKSDNQQWITFQQLKCLYEANGTNNTVFEINTGIWTDEKMQISDIWPTLDNRSVYFTTWDGGTQFQSISLYKTDGVTRAIKIDEVEGLRFNPNNDYITDADVPSVEKKEDQIVVYDPQKKETRTYNL